MAVETSQREKEIRDIWTQHRFLYQISGVIVLVIAATYLGRLLFPGDDGYWSNAYMTVIGVIITIGVLDRLAERREERREMEALKQQLLRDVRSTSNEVAKNAVHQMREQGWLEGEDGLLRGVRLMRANLQGANLFKANLEGADLSFADLEGANLAIINLHRATSLHVDLQRANLGGANLQRADLRYANFAGAFLVGANMQEADLREANLQKTVLVNTNFQGADLRLANMQEADLREVNLEGANLFLANLQGATNLKDAKFDGNTTLPDKTPWKLGIDMERFTNPEHPDF